MKTREFDRFDMEQQVMTCWSICEDLETLCEGVLERDMSADQISNVLLGLQGLYQLKFEKLWDQFEQMCKVLPRKNSDSSGIDKSFDWPAA